MRVAGLKCRVWRLEGRTFGGVAFGVDASPAGRSTGRALMAWGGERGSAALLGPCEAVRVRDVRVRARSSRRAAVDLSALVAPTPWAWPTPTGPPCEPFMLETAGVALARSRGLEAKGSVSA